MAPPPPKSRNPRKPAPTALAAPRARDADISPLPSAPTLELLMEDGFFDEQTSDDPPTYNAPPPRNEGGPDRGHARTTPLAEATVIAMPVCDAVQMAGPTHAQGGEDNDARAGWSVQCGKFLMIGVASLVLVALGTLIGVVVMFVKQDDTVTTSTSSTAIMTSTSSTTSPGLNTVSDKSTDVMIVVFAHGGRRLTHSPFDAYICLPVRSTRHVLKLEATGSGDRRGWFW